MNRLAERIGISKYLVRLFREHYGFSLRIPDPFRMVHASECLLTDDSIHNIALESGYRIRL